MVGRYRDKLMLQGVGSSSAWPRLIERANVPVGLNLATTSDSYLPTDSTSFYVAGVPSLSLFTGAHEDYHKPSDTAEKLHYEAMEKVARFAALLLRGLATADDRPDYIAQSAPAAGERRGGLRAYLGSVPDYAQDESVKGVRLSGVAKGGPAEQAGLRAGDVIVELAGRKIENIYDYTYAIDALKIGQETPIAVVRSGARLDFTITPASRQ
jgi:C-terminal processing protease CtpA/Prc